MHGVLHDWFDEPARKILQMLRDALKPGYSKLLVHDHVVLSTPTRNILRLNHDG